MRFLREQVIVFFPPFSFRLHVVKSDILLYGPDCSHVGTWGFWVHKLMPYLFQGNFHTFFFYFGINCEWQLAYCCSSFSQIDTIFQCAYFLREFAFWMNDRVHLTFMNENEKFAIWINPCLTEYEKGNNCIGFFLYIYLGLFRWLLILSLQYRLKQFAIYSYLISRHFFVFCLLILKKN